MVHAGWWPLSAAWRDITGDALWAAMIFWLIGAAFPRVRIASRGAAAYGICVTVECSQMIRAGWLDAIRTTQIGQLVLGSGFDSRDLAAYAAGVLAAVIIERSLAPLLQRQ
jgi:hypothetical protein